MIVLTICCLSTFSQSEVHSQDSHDFEISDPIESRKGDSERGRKVVLNSDKASCLLCHVIQQLDVAYQGNIAPDLSNVGSRYTASQLRFRLVNPQALNPTTLMPSYWQKQGFRQLDPAYKDQSVYSAQELEDVIAFLLTLKSEGLNP